MTSLGIDSICVFNLPPVEFVNLTADLGCQRMGVFLNAKAWGSGQNPHNYPEYSLIEDGALRRDMKIAMADRGVTLGNVEGFFVFPGGDVHNMKRELDVMADLGTANLITLCLEPDRSRALDQIAALAEMAGDFGINVLLEFLHITALDFPTALDTLRQIDRPNVKLMIDALHFVRSGLTPADLAKIDPARIGGFQFCDGPLEATIEAYRVECGADRLAPGDGAFPLSDIVAALPRNIPFSLEIPQLSLAKAGVGPYDRLKPCVDRVREILADVEAQLRAN